MARSTTEAEQRRLLYALAGVVQEIQRVSAERDDLIREARAAGASVPDIARASGLGTRRVRQVLKL